MSTSRPLLRAIPRARKTAASSVNASHHIPYSSRSSNRTSQVARYIAGVAVIGAGGAVWNSFAPTGIAREVHAEEQAPMPAEVEFEKKRRRGTSKEENRDIISSQHVQVKKSWENPGLYAWGSNSGRVVAPDSQEKYVKTPRRIPFFDGVLLRDVKLDRNFGAAINEAGDLLQWGAAYSTESFNPQVTLKGKNLTSLAISRDRVLALAADGAVYSLPVSQEDQLNGPKPSEGSSWLPFWTSTPSISYRKLQPKDLAWGEKVTSLAAGLEHVLLLTSKGRLFSAAAGTQDFPAKGQLGLPGLTWLTRPEGAYDQCHEITTLKGFDIAKVAAGDFHSLAADKDGRLFAFGDNSLGQLGFEYNPESSVVDAPSLLPVQKLYQGKDMTPVVTNVAAGGNNSYFTVDATKVAGQGASADDPSAARRQGLGRITADTWACGQGIWGGLGNGRWTHVQGTPTKIAALSGLFEWDEAAHKAVPIRLRRISVGGNHVAAVMKNVTHVGAGGTGGKDGGSENDTNWGADIVFWGNNEFYQLGTGKRSNVNSPMYIRPLDMVAERKMRGKEEHRFQITPMHRVKVNGRWVNFEQRVECGRGATAVYSAV